MQWKVPLADLSYGLAEEQAVLDVLKSRWLSMGPRTEQFEKAFAAFTDAKHALAVSNCTAAMHMAHVALGLGPGDEVIVPSLTFVATVNAVIYTGARPVFADVRSLHDWCLSPQTIEPAITPKTKAVVVMHYGGYPCDMTAVADLCRRKGLMLVEDCAHSPGAWWADRHTGTFGQLGCFSFFSNKNLCTGEGGMVITDDEALAEKLRVTRSHGMTTLTWQRHSGHASSYDVVAPGYNYRIDEIRSALGLVQLAKLPANNRKRGQLVEIYRQALAGAPGLSVPFAGHGGRSSYHLFPVLLDDSVDRAAVMGAMREDGIQTSIHYPPAHLFTYMRSKFATGEGLLPLTEQIGRRVLTLPLWADMTEDQLQLVVASLRRHINKQVHRRGKNNDT